MEKILVATDGSAAASEAVGIAVELAAEQGAEVTFVHVLAPDDFVGGRLAARPVPHRLEIDESETALKEAAYAAEEAGVSYDLERVSGEAAGTIVALADEKAVDLIVVGSRGRSAIASTLFGSVSLGVLKTAKRPVLIVRGATVPAETVA